jgi:predicted flap endonuclease-1-like 5' DNA nuclease
MKPRKKDKECKDLPSVPGIGSSITNDLHLIGIHHVNDLIGQDPELLKWWNWKDRIK